MVSAALNKKSLRRIRAKVPYWKLLGVGKKGKLFVQFMENGRVSHDVHSLNKHKL